MSVEQWGVLALIILLPLLQGVARWRQTRVNNDRPHDRVIQAPPPARRGTPRSNRNVSDSVMGAAEASAIPPPPPLPPPLPQPASDAAVPLAPLRAGQTPVFRASGALGTHRRVERPLSGDAVVQWLRPSRNLRRAIVLATILGPPTQ
jgi:hypothetical protein